MKINQKMLLGFFSVELMVLIVGSISIATNNSIIEDLDEIISSNINEINNASTMLISMQSVQSDLQNLLGNRYLKNQPDYNGGEHGEDYETEAIIKKNVIAFEHAYESAIQASEIDSLLNAVDEKNHQYNEDLSEIKLLKDIAPLLSKYSSKTYEIVDVSTGDINAAYRLRYEFLDPLYHDILYKLKSYEESVNSELKSKTFEIKEATEFNSLIIAVTTGLGLLIATLFGLVFSRIISTPLSMFTKAALEIGHGNFELKVDLKNRDELGDLAKTFNRMTQALQTTSESLKKAANYNANIVQSMQDTLLVLSPSGDIQTVNNATLRLLGFTEIEILGKSIYDIAWQEKNGALIFLEIADLIDKNVLKSREIFYQAKNGKRIPMRFTCSIMEGELGDMLGVVCVAQDLTLQKETEKVVQSGIEQLITVNKALIDTQSQLVQSAKLASVGELATGVAHELNQPLGIISMQADLRLNEFKKGKYDKIEASYEMILRQITRATTIINHLRAFGRESNNQARSLHSINKIIEDSFIMIAEQLRLRNIEFVMELGENLSKVHCNNIQIEQVLTNLIMNAKDALEHAPIKHIIVRSWQGNDHVIVEIEDSGTGIPEDIMSKIFDPFFTTKEVGKGTGLGLSISYGIIKDHGGDLSVSSVEGLSTTFRIGLPIIEAVATGSPKVI